MRGPTGAAWRETQDVDAAPTQYSVGRLADLAGVTVRTLHHYDEVGLLVPTARSTAGYRLYSEADLDRLHQVMLYRGLGFSLEEVAAVLDEPEMDTVGHLRRQHELLSERISRLEDMRLAVEKMMEARTMGIKLTREEQFEVFGDNWLGEEYATEAEERWGESEAWKQSQARTAEYSKEQWLQIKAEGAAVEQGLAAAMRAGEPADGAVAMDLAEQHRQQIHRWFYDCDHQFHRNLGQMYTDDPRFAKHYDDIAPGLAQYARDAIVANAERAGA